MLRGMVKCGCGRAMVGQRTGYQCSSVTNRYRGIEARTCFEKRAHGGTLEAIAWDYALSIITDPDGLEQKLRQAQAAELTALQPKRDELDQVNNEIAQVETDAAKIAQALEDMLPEQLWFALVRMWRWA